jgi:hypothetical protein
VDPDRTYLGVFNRTLKKNKIQIPHLKKKAHQKLIQDSKNRGNTGSSCSLKTPLYLWVFSILITSRWDKKKSNATCEKQSKHTSWEQIIGLLRIRNIREMVGVWGEGGEFL